MQSTNSILISKTKYVQNILKKIRLKNCKYVRTIWVETKQCQIVGSCNIMYHVCLVTRFMEIPTKKHYFSAKRILLNLQGTKDNECSKEGEGIVSVYSELYIKSG